MTTTEFPASSLLKAFQVFVSCLYINNDINIFSIGDSFQSLESRLFKKDESVESLWLFSCGNFTIYL